MGTPKAFLPHPTPDPEHLSGPSSSSDAWDQPGFFPQRPPFSLIHGVPTLPHLKIRFGVDIISILPVSPNQSPLTNTNTQGQ